MSRQGTVGLVLTFTVFAGCASNPSTPVSGPGGITYLEHKDLQRVWVAPGFDFNGYDTLYIGETEKEVPRLNPDGLQLLEWARATVQEELAAAIKAKSFFQAVVTREADIPPGAKVLRLYSTILEYEKGGGGARYWVGACAGQPVIRVLGQMSGEGPPVFVFNTRRSGVIVRGTPRSGKTPVGAKLFGGAFWSDKEIQLEDIKDIAGYLADFIVETASGRSINAPIGVSGTRVLCSP